MSEKAVGSLAVISEGYSENLMPINGHCDGSGIPCCIKARWGWLWEAAKASLVSGKSPVKSELGLGKFTAPGLEKGYQILEGRPAW